MRIRITRCTVALNRVVMAGEVLDESVGLNPRDAGELIRLGKAVEIPVAARPEPQPAAEDAAAGITVQAGETPRPSPALTTETAAGLVRKVKKRLSLNQTPNTKH